MVKLIEELRAANALVAVLADQAVRGRLELRALDRRRLGAIARQSPRVLVLDCPGNRGDRCEGETMIISDESIDLYTARVPVGTLHPRFDEAVEAVLATAPRRFQSLVGSLDVKTRSIDRYPRNFRREVLALIDAQQSQNVLEALNQIREELHGTKDETETGTKTQSAQAEVDQPSATRKNEPIEPPGVPW